MNKIFEPITIHGKTLRNRVVMPPMCMYAADEKGYSSRWHEVHYETRSVGGAGLIIQEATAVEPRGRISANDLGIWEDGHMEGLTRIVDRVHAHGAKMGIQLGHAGRKSLVSNEDVISPSPLCYDTGDSKYSLPREMTDKDIRAVLEAFRSGAFRAASCGYDLIEIHAAHGYLLSEFLSPLVNHRTDAYGGREGGTKFLGEIIRAVREVWSGPLQVRVSAKDFAPGGNEPEDLAGVINSVRDSGVDSVNVSSGNVVPVPLDAYNSDQIPFADTIRKETGLPVIAGGMLSDPLECNDIVASGKADMVFLGRAHLRTPYWTLDAAHVLGETIDYLPRQYKRGW